MKNLSRKQLIIMISAVMIALAVGMIVLAAVLAIKATNFNPLASVAAIVVAIVHLVSAAGWGVKAYKDPLDDHRIHSSAGVAVMIIAIVTTAAICVHIFIGNELVRWIAATFYVVGMIAEASEAFDWPHNRELFYVHLVLLAAVTINIGFRNTGSNTAGFWVMALMLAGANIYYWIASASGTSSIAIMLYVVAIVVGGIVNFCQGQTATIAAICALVLGTIGYVCLMVQNAKGRL